MYNNKSVDIDKEDTLRPSLIAALLFCEISTVDKNRQQLIDHFPFARNGIKPNEIGLFKKLLGMLVAEMSTR